MVDAPTGLPEPDMEAGQEVSQKHVPLYKDLKERLLQEVMRDDADLVEIRAVTMQAFAEMIAGITMQIDGQWGMQQEVNAQFNFINCLRYTFKQWVEDGMVKVGAQGSATVQ